MGREFFRLVVPLLFISPLSYCQDSDSLVYAEGNIVNAETKQPVMAKITYQSLPYGSRVGVLNNNSYSFPMYDKEKYSIVVEAPGFDVAKYMLDPTEASGTHKLIKNIELTKGSHVSGQRLSVGNVIRLDNLIFQVGKSRISPESHSELDVVVKMMKENVDMVIQLEGHTDYQGDPKDNMRLSQSRVDAVKSYIASNGIQKNRVKTKAFGGTQPLSRADTPEGHRLNRRVELRILEN